jgi:hypothetical protein
MEFSMVSLSLNDRGLNPLFPVYFRDAYHPTMELSIEPDGTYVLAHPQHIDWYYYIRVDDQCSDIWYVAGVCEDDRDEISLKFFKDDDGRWVSCNWYV